MDERDWSYGTSVNSPTVENACSSFSRSFIALPRSSAPAYIPPLRSSLPQLSRRPPKRKKMPPERLVPTLSTVGARLVAHALFTREVVRIHAGAAFVVSSYGMKASAEEGRVTSTQPF
jgi:hypothetical protein